MSTISWVIFAIAILLWFGSLFWVTVKEGNVGVLTVFGKFVRVLPPGFNYAWPWEKTAILSTQMRAVDLQYQAITLDQANVCFDCTVLFCIRSTERETVRRAAFAFGTEQEMMLSLRRLIEDETRAYAAGKRQAELIGMSQNVVSQIKACVDSRLEQWGYRVEDLRYHNLRFDNDVMKSMARVVAATNEREAAEHEGQALLIKQVKEAEANGAFIQLTAKAECDAWKLRGQGLAEFRREVAKGVHDAVKELDQAGLDPNYLLFFMYTESLKYIAENSKAGHTIFLNTNPNAPKEIIEQMSAFYRTEPRQGPDILPPLNR